ncbi:hypothetical protein [Paraburkholderia sp. GAS32]|jgi:hypothetical protein|uniref:hypothetical protein n=1 Tax=Paraburkholderia sp. GAS32 TaxID=3035129 RepID=UPI003D1C0F8D
MKRWIPVLLLAPAIASHAQAPTASERQRLEAAQALESLDWLKQQCDADGFVRGTPEHADCVRKRDAVLAQRRCQAIVERVKRVCSKEYADPDPVDATRECGAAEQADQQYCQ